MRRARVLVLPVLLVSLLALGAAPASAAGRTIGQVIDDATISAQVKGKLTADALSNLTKIGVKVKDGVVTLSGTVDSADRRARAGQIAASVKGVKSVVNEIQLSGGPATASTPAGAVPASTGATVDATGTVAQVDRATGTITLQDGRVVRTTAQTMVWQPTTLSALRPGDRVLVREAAPTAFEPDATTGARDWRMGTVRSVDRAAGQLVLADGTVVRVTPSTNVHRGATRLGLDQVAPGSEVVVRVPRAAGGAGAPAAGGATTLDASEVDVVWTPVASTR